MLGQGITKTIVINVGSKERNNEETTRSFDNDVSFEVDVWKEIEENVLSRFNSEDEHQDDQKPAAIPTKHPSVSLSAIPHKKPSGEPVVIPHENTVIIAEGERKPTAN